MLDFLQQTLVAIGPAFSHPSITMKPVLFLDVDDTMIVWPGGRAAPEAGPFVLWAKEHFEVRWLTMWGPSGRIARGDAMDLARKLGLHVSVIDSIVNPYPFPVIRPGLWGPIDNWREKSVSIARMLQDTPDREWAWVEDPHLTMSEREWTRLHPHRYYETTVSRDILELRRTAIQLAKDFGLPPMELQHVAA